MSRADLLAFIQEDQELHVMAAEAEAWVHQNRGDLELGSDQFYAAVLKRLRVLTIRPPVPTFEAPPSFHAPEEG